MSWASIVALIGRRQWLTKVGPVEVSEQVFDIDTENAALKSRLKREQEPRSFWLSLAEADAMMHSLRVAEGSSADG